MDKRLSLAKTLLGIGCGHFCRLWSKDRLFIFTYHRIKPEGKPADTLFDTGVFGPSVDVFRQQLEFISKHSKIISEDELIGLLSNKRPANGPLSLITFDDTYIDNYDLALPVLRELGIPAVFFTPCEMVENRQLGWWDEIAYILKTSGLKRFKFMNIELDLGSDREKAIATIQAMVKTKPYHETESLIDDLAQAAKTNRPGLELMDKEIMTWEQIKIAEQSGITMGSHTCNHYVLATLTPEQQRHEIFSSKQILEQKIGKPVRSIAFPVGGCAHYNQESLKLAEEAGYEVAYSFNTGACSLQDMDRMQMPRVGAPSSMDHLKAFYYFPKLMDYQRGAPKRINPVC